MKEPKFALQLLLMDVATPCVRREEKIKKIKLFTTTTITTQVIIYMLLHTVVRVYEALVFCSLEGSMNGIPVLDLIRQWLIVDLDMAAEKFLSG